MHSGGHVGTIRTQYRYHAGKFHCGQIVVLMALTDIGPGDGATMVVPGSHKSNIKHPQTVPVEMRGEDISIDGVAGAIEAHLKARGTSCCSSTRSPTAPPAGRTSDGERRVASYRYGPELGLLPLPLPPERGAACPPDAAAPRDGPAAWRVVTFPRHRRRSDGRGGVLGGRWPARQPAPAALLPPSIAIEAPVIIAAASEHRKRISAATSPGSIRRPQAAASGALRR